MKRRYFVLLWVDSRKNNVKFCTWSHLQISFQHEFWNRTSVLVFLIIGGNMVLTLTKNPEKASFTASKGFSKNKHCLIILKALDFLKPWKVYSVLQGVSGKFLIDYWLVFVVNLFSYKSSGHCWFHRLVELGLLRS